MRAQVDRRRRRSTRACVSVAAAFILVSCTPSAEAQCPASLIKDIFPGPTSITANPFFGPLVTYIDGTLYFTADDGIHGAEFWKSDGTAEGTVMIKDFIPGSSGSFARAGFLFNGKQFLIVTDNAHGREPWISDGTENGTVVLKDINPGSTGSFPRLGPRTVDTMYFTANDGTHGLEIWRTDATPEGTFLMVDLFPGGASSFVEWARSLNNEHLFVADDGIHGIELWKTDGTESGTVIVSDIQPGSAGSSPGEFRSVNNSLFFLADDGVHGRELWKTDGSTGGTVLVADINPGGVGSDPDGVLVFDDRVLFEADDGTHGRQLWSSDGTSEGTVMLANASPGQRARLNGSLYFTTGEVTNALQLWKTDGTPEGTALVKSILPGSDAAVTLGFRVVGNLIFFTAINDIGTWELWRSDGTPAGTGDVGGPAYDNPVPLTEFEGELLFSAYWSNARSLWRTNGTTVGTTMIKPSLDVLAEFPVGDRLFLIADDGIHGAELWRTDGTTDGTFMIQDINAGASDSNPENIIILQDKMYFIAADDEHGAELRTMRIPTSPACDVGTWICGGKITIDGLGSGSGQQRLRASATLPLAASYPFNPGSHGIQILVDDLGSGETTVFDLTADTTPVPPGLRGALGACGVRDGWKVNRARNVHTYTNYSGMLDVPTCTAASANGLSRLRFVDRRKRGGAIDFEMRTRNSTLAAAQGPLRATLVMGSTIADSIGGDCAVMTTSDCVRSRSGSQLTCR